MMTPKFALSGKLTVGINGFGRIGRCVLRALADTTAFKEGQVQVAKINDLTDASTLAHLFKYDSVHGVFNGEVKTSGESLSINGIQIPVVAEPNPSKLKWGDASTDLVLECTGRFKSRDEVAAHLSAGAKKAVMSAPLKGADLTVVVGINENQIDLSKHDVLSNASCTTNCLAPVAKVIHDSFKIEYASMTTVHSYTNDQRILDLPHSDLRRARAAALSMIPTTTGAAKAVGLVLPELQGKIDGISVRVPTPNVSLVDLNAWVQKETSKEEVNAALKAASQGALKGILAFEEDELVSSDFKGRPESSLIDSPFTNVTGKNLVKVMAWYDNEWGFSCRMVDLSFYLGSKMS